MTDPGKLKLAAILLAAGASRRLGKPKQLVRHGGVSLVRRSAELLLSLEIAPLVAVSGCCAQKIESELQGLSLDIANNNDWKEGMGGSIACGALKIPETADGVLVMPCDQWKLQKADLCTLISAWSRNISDIYIAQWKSGKRLITGPPVIFPGKYIYELRFVKGNSGARVLIERSQASVHTVALQNAKFDLDEPRDLVRLRQA